MPIHALDDPGTYRRYDPRCMLKHLHDIPTSCQNAWHLASRFELPSSYRDINKIVILGMGGSAIGADLVVGMNECRKPIVIHRGYTLPPFVDADTLVIASSYSGMTEETNAAFAQAITNPAKKMAMTTGGKLGQLATEHHLPCFTFDYASPPRAALPYSLIPLLNILSKLGFMCLATDGIDAMVSALTDLERTVCETQPYEQNSAKKLAQAMHNKVCVVYGGEFLSEVGHRWKLQINENAKAVADYESFPELNHNTIVGYHFPSDVLGKIVVTMLTSELLDARIRRRYAVTQKLLNKTGIDCHVISAHGANKISQMLELILFGDYVSYYLALLNQTDPYPLDEVNYLKDELSRYAENERTP